MASALEVGEASFGAVHDDLRCRLRVTGVDAAAIRVGSFEAREGLSALFRYEIDVATDSGDVGVLEDALGRDASFFVDRDGQPERVVHGIVTEVVPDGTYVGKRQARTTIVVEPRLASLRESGGYRIFQKQTVRQIVEELVAPERLDMAWRVRPELAEREYRTQLDETDFDFIARLAADEGLHFFFEHDDEKTTLVFTNSPKGFTELAGGAKLEFHDTSGAVASEHVRTIRRGQRIRTGAVEHRDYDFRKPRLALVGRAETGEPQKEGNAKRRERRDYPGGFLDPDAEGTPRAQMRLEELRSDAYTVYGAAASLRLGAGKKFTLDGHRDDAFNQELLVTGVSFGGGVDGAHSELGDGGRGLRASASLARFDAVPADTPLRPARRRKPSSRLQTARVVGPKEGDPFVDELGRIKVQFMWDRDGQMDEHSSCWIRMMTPAAHDDEGFWSAHKVGSEVLVDFVDGDIDQPVVLGAIYNGRERQPYKQPDHSTRSSWKVRSIPGGKGHNEITFENQAGKEELLTHAERDRSAKVKRNDAETIGANQTTSVGAAQTTNVGAGRTAAIGANDTTTIGGDRIETVEQKEDVTVKKGRTHTVQEGGDALHLPHGDREVTVYEGNHTRRTKLLDKCEADNIESHARYDVHVTGDRKVEARQGKTTATMEAGNVEVHAEGRVLVHHKNTTVLIDDAGKVTVTADPDLEMNCGGAQVKMGKGKVELKAPTELTLAVGQSGLKLTADGWEMSGAKGKLTALTGPIEVAGLLVKLN